MTLRIEYRHGMVRVAVASPRGRVADVAGNVRRHIALMNEAQKQGVEILVFPELSLPKYSAQDLHHHLPVIEGVIDGLFELAEASRKFDGLMFVGLQLIVQTQPFNCLAAIKGGEILGIVPKSAPPNTKEFEEERFFRPAAVAKSTRSVTLRGKEIPFGIDLLFECSNVPWLVVGAEICEDGWLPVPPSAYQVLAGATVIVNGSASNETVGKASFRHHLFNVRAATYLGAYLYSSSGAESTNDLVFGGDCFISENGTILAKNKRFDLRPSLTVSDVDLERLVADRLRTNSFGECARMVGAEHLEFRRIAFQLKELKQPRKLKRKIDPHPFVPGNPAELAERCEEIDNIQVMGLVERLIQVCRPLESLYGIDPHGADLFSSILPTPEQLAHVKVSIGVSGGLDSTRALLVACKAFDLLGIPRKNILAFTLPGFGTSARTKKNALLLMQRLGVTIAEVDIRQMCFQEMIATGMKPAGIDLVAIEKQALNALKSSDTDNPIDHKAFMVTLFEQQLKGKKHLLGVDFENVQARMRTLVLMQAGFVVGTGTLSELAKGWCTYNADHMSMYNVNAGVPKTLVKFLVRWAAEHQFASDQAVRETLLDIVDTPMSPELIPTGDEGEIVQKTEVLVGPYELTDFYLYYLLRFGMSPTKILYLAEHAFEGIYSEDEQRHWMCDFIERFFRQQFKRSCVPNGTKVGSVCLSPRGDWRMPSDACAALWLDWLDEAERAQRIAHWSK